ncbi:hypothetical protein DRO66_00265 [Candidatus Bathyarchaeota archaeon]|nr:MAG: hypothetical protein DRO66_00265 [Candidatus Bathyarchaeota archaeon]
MIYLKNQPYPMNADLSGCDCCDEVEIAQLVDQGDVTQFQNLITVPVFSPQVVDDSTFSLTVGGGSPWTIVSPTWTVGGGQLCKALNGAASASQSFQLGVFVVGSYYQVTVVVDSLSGGTFDLTIGGNIFTVSTIGTFVYNILASSDGFRVFGDDDVLGCLSVAQAFEIFPQYTKVLVKDQSGVVLDEINPIDNPDDFEIIDNSITTFFDWSDFSLPDGCYRLCVADPNENTGGQNFLFNGNFDIDGFSGDEYTTGWLLTNGTGSWQITGGNLEYNSSGFGDIGLAENILTDYTPGIVYDVEVVVSAVTDTSVSVKIGTVAGPAISTVGTHNFQITPDAANLNLTVLTGGAGATSIAIDSITPTKNLITDYVGDAEGPLVKLDSYECTYLINACHNGGVAGFNFDGSFSPHLRIDGRIGRSTFPGQRITNKLSNGVYRNTFWDSEQHEQFQIGMQPPYVHSFLRMLLGYYYVAINGTRIHVHDDEYIPVYGEDDMCNAQSVLEISNHPQPDDPNITFRDCTGLDKSCANGGFLLLEQSTNYLLLQSGGRIILNP